MPKSNIFYKKYNKIEWNEEEREKSVHDSIFNCDIYIDMSYILVD